MRKLKITDTTLAALSACPDARARFRRAYPKGIVVTDDQLENFAILIAHRQRGVSIEIEDSDPSGDLAWLFVHLSGGCGCACAFCQPLIGHLHGGEFLIAGELADAVGVYIERRRRSRS